jgi:hypothetical protein
MRGPDSKAPDAGDRGLYVVQKQSGVVGFKSGVAGKMGGGQARSVSVEAKNIAWLTAPMTCSGV